MGCIRLKTRICLEEQSSTLRFSHYIQYIFWFFAFVITVKILKIWTPEIITIFVLQLEQLDFTVQYCVQKMQTE